MSKDKTVKKKITITPNEWEMAQKDSKTVTGRENVSGYIRQLVRDNNEKLNR